MSNTRITEPGKFEGEAEYIRDVYWPMMLESASDESHIDDTGQPFDVFFLTADDIPVKTGHAEVGDVLALWESEQGFAMSRIMSPADYAELLASIATDDSTEDQ